MIWNSIFFQLNIEYSNYKFKILNNDKFLYITKEILSQVHIKNLISYGILYIDSSEIVNGIEQKRFLPTSKNFQIGQKNLSKKSNKHSSKINISNKSFIPHFNFVY